MKYFVLLIMSVLSSLGLGNILFAQGNTCDTAIRINNPRNFCSGVGAYNTNSMTPSTYDPSYCFHGRNKDIWFSFTAVASHATITITGKTMYAEGGSMLRPEISLYQGVCGGTLAVLRCEADDDNNNIVELRRGGLSPGETYLIRVQSATAEGGSFQLCLNNFNPPVTPGQDCKTAAVLCDKSSFTVEKVYGAGVDATELNDAECFFNGIGGGNYESSSTWFKFTCKTSGPLEFTLTPLNKTDDLDFVLYELPHGLKDCSDKIVIRCMAAGEIPELYPSPCHGPTGLREGNRDVSEPAGCQGGNNNFLAPAMLEQGKTYVLAVNNYSDTDHGFVVEWGGTSEFLGPEPNIKIETLNDDNCYTDAVTISDASQNATGEIISWSWSFGNAANPQTAEGKGPHTINYDKAGVKMIQLRVESDKGCVSTFTEPLELFCCDVDEYVYIGEDAYLGLGEIHQFISEVRLKGTEISYSWMPDSTLTCYYCPDPIAMPLEEVVKYTLRVEDEYGCSATDEATLFVTMDYPYFIPNAFTPNSDGLNDHFTIFSGVAAKEIKILEIYNRWGDKVFSRVNFPVNETAMGWDGKINGQPAQEGTYMYRAILEFVNGKRINLAGDLTIIK